MKAIFIGLALVAASTSALADAASDLQEKVCIINAATKLPVIPGLAIVGTRVSPPNNKIRRVEIDFKAAGVDTTMVFSCGPGINVVEGFSK